MAARWVIPSPNFCKKLNSMFFLFTRNCLFTRKSGWFCLVFHWEVNVTLFLLSFSFWSERAEKYFFPQIRTNLNIFTVIKQQDFVRTLVLKEVLQKILLKVVFLDPALSEEAKDLICAICCVTLLTWAWLSEAGWIYCVFRFASAITFLVLMSLILITSTPCVWKSTVRLETGLLEF